MPPKRLSFSDWFTRLVGDFPLRTCVGLGAIVFLWVIATDAIIARFQLPVEPAHQVVIASQWMLAIVVLPLLYLVLRRQLMWIATEAQGRALADESARFSLAALRNSEARWQFALDGAGDGVWDYDMVTGAVFLSPQWKRNLGYAEGDNPTWEDISRGIHPEDVPRTLPIWQEHVAGKTPGYSVEYRQRRKDGEYLWVLVRGLIVSRDAEGHALRAVGTSSDISVRKQSEADHVIAEQAQHALRQEFEQFFSLVPDMACMVSMDGKMQKANPAWSAALRLAPSELLLNTALTPVHPGDHATTRAALARLLAGKPVTGLSNRALFPDGKYHWLEWEIVPFRGMIYATARDTTQRRENEVSLRNALQLATVGKLGAGIAHEIRNPLISIKAVVSMLPTHHSDPAFMHKFLPLVDGELDRIEGLIAELLKLAKPHNYMVGQHDIVPLVAGVVELAAVQAARGNATVRVQLKAGEVASVDPEVVTKVALNLILNGLQCFEAEGASSGEHWVLVSVQRVKAGVELTVEDNGPGIPQEHRSTLFEAFRTTKANGFGLGLFVCRDILHQTGANITVDPYEAGRGALFRVTFPAVPKPTGR